MPGETSYAPALASSQHPPRAAERVMMSIAAAYPVTICQVPHLAAAAFVPRRPRGGPRSCGTIERVATSAFTRL